MFDFLILSLSLSSIPNNIPGMNDGDILRLRYLTFDPETIEIFEESFLEKVDVEEAKPIVLEYVVEYLHGLLLGILSEVFFDHLLQFFSIRDTSEQHDTAQVLTEGRVNLSERLRIDNKRYLEMPRIKTQFVHDIFG